MRACITTVTFVRFRRESMFRTRNERTLFLGFGEIEMWFSQASRAHRAHTRFERETTKRDKCFSAIAENYNDRRESHLVRWKQGFHENFILPLKEETANSSRRISRRTCPGCDIVCLVQVACLYNCDTWTTNSLEDCALDDFRGCSVLSLLIEYDGIFTRVWKNSKLLVNFRNGTVFSLVRISIILSCICFFLFPFWFANESVWWIIDEWEDRTSEIKSRVE